MGAIMAEKTLGSLKKSTYKREVHPRAAEYRFFD